MGLKPPSCAGGVALCWTPTQSLVRMDSCRGTLSPPMESQASPKVLLFHLLPSRAVGSTHISQGSWTLCEGEFSSCPLNPSCWALPVRLGLNTEKQAQKCRTPSVLWGRSRCCHPSWVSILLFSHPLCPCPGRCPWQVMDAMW